ncbi:MAG: GNAT family N-acetyltransferase [Candidatus Krumholzibacteriota bacterium]|nr:GNAT family N-acetyltransferase [Candidatus Krumholzibacteriota bacterium]
MRYHRYDDVASFLADWEECLLRRESANNLMLGIALRLAAGHAYSEEAPVLRGVFDGVRPVLAALMTPPHRLAIHCEDAGACQDGLERLAAGLAGDGVALPGVVGPKDPAGRFAEIWTRTAGCASRVGMRMRVFELREVADVTAAPGAPRRAGEGDLDLAVDWTVAFSAEAVESLERERAEKLVRVKLAAGDIWFWEDGGPVAMAAKARPTVNGCTVNLVYTPPDRRRRGYATSLVAHLSRHLLGEGYAFCNLFTDLANPTSNSIYMKVGYLPVCDFDELHFEAP